MESYTAPTKGLRAPYGSKPVNELSKIARPTAFIQLTCTILK